MRRYVGEHVPTQRASLPGHPQSLEIDQVRFMFVSVFVFFICM